MVIASVAGWDRGGGWPCIYYRALLVVMVVVLFEVLFLGARGVGKGWQASLVLAWGGGW